MEQKARSIIIGSILFFIAGCGATYLGPTRSSIEEPKYSIFSRVPFVSINGENIEEWIVVKRPLRPTTVTYSGPVNLTVASKPIVPIKEENVSKNAMTACLAALPICPLTLTLMAAVSGTRKHVEANCSTTLTFLPNANEKYFVKLEATDNILPVLKIIQKTEGTVIASEKLSCEGYHDAPAS